MPNPTIQPSMAGGELAPSLWGRVDLARYLTSLKTCKNFVSQVYGGVRNRPGTRYMAHAKYADKKTRLIPFIFNQDQAYVLELGDHYMRAFTDGLPLYGATNQPNNGTMTVFPTGLGTAEIGASINTFVPSDVGRTLKIAVTAFYDTFVITSVDFPNQVTATCPRDYTGITIEPSPYWKFSGNAPGTYLFETVTPWAEDELFDLVYSQSADVLTVTHPDHPPQDIRRLSDGTFEVRPTTYINGPFQDVNVDKTVTVTITGTTGTITINASAPIFKESHIGMQFYVEPMSYGQPWAAGKAVTSGDVRMANGKFYRAQNSATTGTIAPSHDEDVASDGAVNWLYLHSGFGVMTITGVSDAFSGKYLSATATAQNTLPEGLNVGTVSPVKLTVTSFAVSPADSSRVRVVVPVAHGLTSADTVGYFATL